MARNERSAINPFTNKKHLDFVNDDKFLDTHYNEYYRIINNSELIDNTEEGLLVAEIANNLIEAVERFLNNIGRSDYTKDYYEWEFHLVNDPTVNAWCMPGGKIVMYSGMFGPANDENDLALILGHEMAHALLDHSRTQVSARKAKNGITTAARIGSIGLSLFGFGEAAALTRAVTNVADIGSELLVLKPFGRDHEFEADRLGMMIMHWAGYDIEGVPDFWSRVSNQNRNEHDFFSTHPADSKRIAKMEELIIEIENGKDFYNTPVLGDGSFQNDDVVQIPSDKVKCPKCGNLVDDSNNFCIYCGNSLENVKVPKPSKICPKCGFSNDEDSSFCIECGSNLKEQLEISSNTCSKCGKTLKNTDKFCTGCGTPVDGNFSSLNCPKCGKQIKGDELFCTNCGEKL
ncbi:MAG: M48 family metallopeptidase [Methanobrevibacter sp.]|uniref:M48 family metallopeptidase n=1 Tax=Methanobrevibacter sp. TaxID=66852 RepID=UPI0026E10535|nr:M48 family metallopeptidase [Methanobrevibacter sp.]MDO5848415.1 M48 family metallopeptidase [Methanobrevibacter sp.]